MSKQKQMVVTPLKKLSFKEIGLYAKGLPTIKAALVNQDRVDLKISPQDIIRHLRNLFIFIVLGLSVYIFALDFLIRLDTRTGTVTNATLLLLCGGIGYQLISKSPYPKEVHGLHLTNWKLAVKEAISWSLGFIGVAIALKAWLITFVPAFQELPILTLNVFYNSDWSNVLVVMFVYSLFVPVQELLCRCLIQGTLQQTFEGR